MGRRTDIAVLGLSQIVGYGTLYYGFATLAPSMARDFDRSTAWIFGAFSCALLVGGVVAPSAGHMIDRLGAGRVMSSGSILATIGLVAEALAPNFESFVVALVIGQIAATLVQYGAAFPLLVQRHGTSAGASIVLLTLIAGFASTIFWPATAWLHEVVGWRNTCLAFAAMHLLVGFPIHFGLSRASAPRTSPAGPRQDTGRTARSGRLEGPLRRMALILVGIAFAFQSFVGAAVLVHMPPTLEALHLGSAGVFVGTLFGPAQVASRLVNMIFGRNLPQTALSMISAALLTMGVALLLATAPSFAGAVAFALLFGMGNGLFSIVGGTLPLALFGSEGYGALQGRIMAIRLVVGATAPFLFAFAADRYGIHATLAATAIIGVLAVAALAAIALLARLNRSTRPDGEAPDDTPDRNTDHPPDPSPEGATVPPIRERIRCLPSNAI